MSENLIISLREIGPEQKDLVGGKALALAQLLQAGLPVPDGFCITSAALDLFLAHNQLQADAPPSSWQQASFPKVLQDAVTEALAGHFGAKTVAVRSSAFVEDSVGASFAGQFETYLNVPGAEGVLAATKACWLSRCNTRVTEYARRHNGIQNGGMAVIVQEQIGADAAGVLFTLNPANGDENEMVIEAVWGLGAGLVGGEQTPERYFADAQTGVIRRFEAGAQKQMITICPGGGTAVVALDRSMERVLSDDEVGQLVHWGERIQEYYGYPQDVEWARRDGRFYILQARPITSISFCTDGEQWTSANLREVMPGFPSTFSVSLSSLEEYGEAFAELFDCLKMGKPDPTITWVRLFFGRPYWNVSAVKRYNALIPGFSERAFDVTVGIEPEYEGDGLVTPWTVKTVARGVPVLLALEREYSRCLRLARSYCEHFRAKVWPALNALDLDAMPWQELAQAVADAIELHREANKLAMRVAFLCTQAEGDFALLMSWVNRRLPPEEQVAEGDLLTGLVGVGTAAPNMALWELARSALTLPAVKEAVVEGAAKEIPARLQQTEEGRTFLQRLRQFREDFRFMSEVDEDLYYPRWDEDDSFILSMLQAYAKSDESVSPQRQVAEQEYIRSLAEKRVRKAMQRGWRRLWLWPRFRFNAQLRLVRRYVWWREETRIVASCVFYHCRRVLLELGRRWCRVGMLERPDDIFMLTADQVRTGLAGKLSAEEARVSVRSYWRTRRLYRNFEPPGTIGGGGSVSVTKALGEARRFYGVACSSGIVIGRARVAQSLDEATALQRGEVLVAPFTNPGWTPLFNIASALIMEEGGLLSHGAVVAREFGIPTVLRIEKATKLIQNGQLLRVDGGRGIVELLDG